jgi:O-antigen/teichoic acid export membrane protein
MDEHNTKLVSPSPPSFPQPKKRLSLLSVVMRLSLVTGTTTAVGLITGPLQARSLGPSGRGELAAITVVGLFLPIIAGLGLEAFVTRETARGTPPGEVIGSIGLMTLIIGLVLAPLGFPMSALLAGHHHVVRLFILIQFLMLPFSLLAQILYYLLVGLERWTAITAFRLIPALGAGLAIVILFITGSMTVSAVAIATIVTVILGVCSGLPALKGIGRLRVRPDLLRLAIPFGLQTWLGTLAVLTNGRLDQLLMIGLVSPRQLGLYAVAVTASSLSNQIAYSLSSPLLSRVAAGERQLVARSLRITLGFVVMANATLALLIPFVLPWVFGSHFREAVPMALILLAAAVPLCVTSVLSPAMVADGHPRIPATAEGLTLLITVPGLLLVLPSMGAIGAALVSFVAYSANAAVQLRGARVNFGARTRDFVLPGRADALWARHRLVGVLTNIVKRARVTCKHNRTVDN